MINILKDMLLIEDQSVFRLYEELIKITNYFIAPVFTISLILEFFREMNFAEPVKKLFLVVIFMGAFYTFHTEATKIALESASITLKKVSPTNLFVKKWTQIKVQTKEKKGKLAEHQIKSAKDASTMGRATQVTAQNTALIYEQNVEMHNTQLEILEKMSTSNRLQAEQLEDKRLEQIQKQKFYGIDKDKK